MEGEERREIMAITYQLARGPQIAGLTNTHTWFVNQIDDSKGATSTSDPMVRVYAVFPALPSEAVAVYTSLTT
jgi:hypothetical protein